MVQAEVQKGYFDDFKELRDKNGRVFEPDAKLTIARTAATIPDLKVSLFIFWSHHHCIYGRDTYRQADAFCSPLLPFACMADEKCRLSLLLMLCRLYSLMVQSAAFRGG